jgi:hypothetical protein
VKVPLFPIVAASRSVALALPLLLPLFFSWRELLDLSIIVTRAFKKTFSVAFTYSFSSPPFPFPFQAVRFYTRLPTYIYGLLLRFQLVRARDFNS